MKDSATMFKPEFMIHELMPARESVCESMRKLIDAHAATHPQGNWSPYLVIDYDRETPRLARDWCPALLRRSPPSNVPVAGLWFGLFQPTRGSGPDRESVADFYVAGARRFELDDGDGEWAVNPAWFPEGRYANSDVLAEIHRLAYKHPEGLGNIAEEHLCLGYVAFTLRDLLAGVEPSLIIGRKSSVGVAIGWDSGDPYYVGFMTPEGFVPRDPEKAIAGIERQQAAFDKRYRSKHGSSGN